MRRGDPKSGTRWPGRNNGKSRPGYETGSAQKVPEPLEGSIKFTTCLILQIFFSLNKNLYVNLCDEEQVDDVKM